MDGGGGFSCVEPLGSPLGLLRPGRQLFLDLQGKDVDRACHVGAGIQILAITVSPDGLAMAVLSQMAWTWPAPPPVPVSMLMT